MKEIIRGSRKLEIDGFGNITNYKLYVNGKALNRKNKIIDRWITSYGSMQVIEFTNGKTTYYVSDNKNAFTLLDYRKEIIEYCNRNRRGMHCKTELYYIEMLINTYTKKSKLTAKEQKELKLLEIKKSELISKINRIY